MRKATFNYIRDILVEHPRIEEYIKKREEELRHPYRESDINAGIKGSRQSYDALDNLMVTMEQDKNLQRLKRNKVVIDSLLEEADADTKVIISELYMKRYARYTMGGLIGNGLIFVGRTKAYELRDKFFLEVAKDLDLNI